MRSSEDGRVLGDQTLDVSWSGIRARSLTETRIGEAVSVSLRLPGSTKWIEAEGAITRVCSGRRPEEQGRSVGVRLHKMDGMLRLLLATVSRSFPPSRAARGESRDYARAVQRIASRG